MRSRLQGEVGSVQGEVRSRLQGEVGSRPQGEVGSVRGEVGSVRGEVGSVRGEVGSARGEVGSVQREVGSIPGVGWWIFLPLSIQVLDKEQLEKVYGQDHLFVDAWLE